MATARLKARSPHRIKTDWRATRRDAFFRVSARQWLCTVNYRQWSAKRHDDIRHRSRKHHAVVPFRQSTVQQQGASDLYSVLIRRFTLEVRSWSSRFYLQNKNAVFPEQFQLGKLQLHFSTNHKPSLVASRYFPPPKFSLLTNSYIALTPTYCI